MDLANRDLTPLATQPKGGGQPQDTLGPAGSAGMQAFIDWLEQCLIGLERQLPAITRSAEEAARIYGVENYGIRTEGAPGVVSEAVGRCGGLMHMNVRRRASISLNFPLAAAAAATSRRWRKGSPTITFAPRWMFAERRTADRPAEHLVLTHSAPAGGLLQRPDGSSLVDLDSVAAVAALWVWTGEFVAACTRLGRMPCMFQAYAVPGGRERAARLFQTGAKFHAEAPPPVSPGQVGLHYLAALRRSLIAVYTSERERVRLLAEMAVTNLAAGRGSYIFPMNHVFVRGNLGGPFDPGYFRRINDGWERLLPGISLAEGDLIFCNGGDAVEPLGELAAQWRATGARLVWSFSDYNTAVGAGRQTIGADELCIDPHWLRGDAAVEVPGYDVQILPTSGVIAAAILRLVEAEILRLTGGKAARELHFNHQG